MSGLYLDSNTDMAAKEPEPKIEQKHVNDIMDMHLTNMTITLNHGRSPKPSIVKFTLRDQPPFKPQFSLGCNAFKYLPVLTHCNVGQLVCTAVWIDGVQCWTIQVNTPQDKCSTDVSLISI